MADSKYIKENAANFTLGYTYLSEIGKPLLVDWDPIQGYPFRECFASHFTDAYMEDFRIIARQYAAGYKEGSPSMILGKLGVPPSDNVWAQHYVLAEAGIRHADLDMLFPCEECTFVSKMQASIGAERFYGVAVKKIFTEYRLDRSA